MGSVKLYEDFDLVLEMDSGYSVDIITGMFGITIDQHLPQLDIYLVTTPDSANLDLLAEQIDEMLEVQFCHPNYLIDPLQPVQSSLPISDEFFAGSYEEQEAAVLLNLAVVHELSTGAGIKVAILDGGVNYDHPALLGSVVSGYDYVDEEPDANDEPGGSGYGHGTFMAGVVHLVAPDANIWSYRVADTSGEGNGYVIAEAMVQAVKDGCSVINLSLVTNETHEAIAQAAEYARQNDVGVVVAAGNGYSEDTHYPASDPNTLAVAAVDTLNALADFSSYGEHIDICAPGTAIYGPYQDTGYAWWGGTSFATPFVSAQAALIQALLPGIAWDYVFQLITNNTTNIDYANEGFDGLLGDGLINPEAALLDGYLVCGDVTRDGAVDIRDLSEYWLCLYGNLTLVRPDLADIDQWTGVNGNDFQRFCNYMFQGGNSTECTPTLELPFPQSDDTLELRNCRIPPYNDSWAVELWLTSTGSTDVDAVVFPFRLVDSLSSVIIETVDSSHPAGTLVLFDNIDSTGASGILGLHYLYMSSLPSPTTTKLATIRLSNTYSESVQVILIDTTTTDPSNTVMISRNGGSQPTMPVVLGIASNLGQYGPSCFGDIRGNVDCGSDETINIIDLIVLVDYMFSDGPTPGCFDEADLDVDGETGIGDLVFLVDYMFNNGVAPPACP
jgi:hypothetical protein